MEIIELDSGNASLSANTICTFIRAYCVLKKPHLSRCNLTDMYALLVAIYFTLTPYSPSHLSAEALQKKTTKG